MNRESVSLQAFFSMHTAQLRADAPLVPTMDRQYELKKNKHGEVGVDRGVVWGLQFLSGQAAAKKRPSACFQDVGLNDAFVCYSTVPRTIVRQHLNAASLAGCQIAQDAQDAQDSQDDHCQADQATSKLCSRDDGSLDREGNVWEGRPPSVRIEGRGEETTSGQGSSLRAGGGGGGILDGNRPDRSIKDGGTYSRVDMFCFV